MFEKGGKMAKGTEKAIKEKKYSILIVDDEAPVRRLIDCLLKEMEYNTHQASNGDEAIEILKKNHNNVHLIIMDLLLPGKHGLDICSKIRAMDNFRDIPILVITAVYTKSKYNYQSREYGADAFMTKPFDNDAFMAQVSRLLSLNEEEEFCVAE